ncbi:probable folate-biopterin transporter 2 isoform X1 [Brassica rapa]|uniref:probable folate-biopterin transporter 2 isoform X1 n=1 Tax=Brassica campestris TaxID=3711 RepID=UPI00142DF148|nr:probable folate-biopterin transporter 2 isoform X1 [Brassica rapa]
MVVEEQNLESGGSVRVVIKGESHLRNVLWGPVRWIKMLAKELHWSFVFGVVSLYGINQGLGGSLGRVATEYYMKDVQKVQPSESQALTAITKIPWIIKPLWGILTDVLPIYGFHRRPYFVLAGVLGVVSMLFISVLGNLHLYLALLWMTIASAAMAIADVTIDACTAYNSIKHPSLASDMQSLCSLSSSIGALLGFFMSGILVHLVGSKGVFGLLTLPFALASVVGMVFSESHVPGFSYKQVMSQCLSFNQRESTDSCFVSIQVNQKFIDAGRAMWRTMKCSDVWRPSLYMYISLALSLNIHEGLFYWFTDSKDGPLFAQETVGFILSIGSVGSILGATLYQLVLKDHAFRGICLWTQLLFALAGMLDLILVLRLNLKLGLPDYLFIVVDEVVSQMIGRLKWMPLLVLTSKLCPHGIEGTFFALLMSIDNAGFMTSSWLGGVLLHVLNVTRTEFGNLWLAVLIRNVLRVSPLFVLFLVPKGDQNTFKLPGEIIGEDSDSDEEKEEARNLELASLVHSADRR